jgi:hypothetical protein
MRFLRRVVILWLLVATLIGGAAFFGRAYAVPNKLQTLGFEQCSGYSCFLGITPGLTSLDEASAILKQHGFSTVTEGLNYMGRMVVDLQRDPDRNTIGNLGAKGLSYASLSVPLGDIVGYLGSPCGYHIVVSNVVELTIVYRNADVAVRFSQDRISPTTSITDIYIRSAYFWNLCEGNTPWPGFTSVRHYVYLQASRSD